MMRQILKLAFPDAALVNDDSPSVRIYIILHVNSNANEMLSEYGVKFAEYHVLHSLTSETMRKHP